MPEQKVRWPASKFVSSPGEIEEKPSQARFAVCLLAAMVAGAILGITQARFWVGIVVLVPLCLFGIPWVMLQRKRP